MRGLQETVSEQDEEIPETIEIRTGEEFEVDRVENFCKSNISGLEGTLQVLQFPGGHANLTYLLRFQERELVLRRPPFGPVGPGAHDMVREHKVLSQLWEHFDRAPRAFALCEDKNLIGAIFFVMERRNGVVVRNSLPEEIKNYSDVQQRISFALVDAMCDFHSVNPKTSGLSDLGKPEGFLARQLKGWYERWQLSKDREVKDFEKLYNWLEKNLPESPKATLIHNDFKLDNCQFDPKNPDRVQTIFDWDMTTLGDPLVDLGTLLGYWIDSQQGGENAIVTLMAQPGFPTPSEIAERYARTRNVPVESISWYASFALWKTAVVAQQIFIRFKRGQTKDERFIAFGDQVPVLCKLGLETTQGLLS